MAVLSLNISAPTDANILNVTCAMGLVVPTLNLTKLVSPGSVETFVGIFPLQSSASQPASRTVQFAASAINSGSNLQSQNNSSYCYSLMIFEVLSA